ncbi:MAG: transposase [Paramuribaculum sp.]|nr:transposase [Paramuribaculum sp.]
MSQINKIPKIVIKESFINNSTLETLLWGDAPVCPHCGTMDKGHWKLTFEFQSL